MYKSLNQIRPYAYFCFCLHLHMRFVLLENMVKPEGAIWKYFTKKIIGNKTTGTCLFCTKACYANHATRMKKHLIKCKNCPDLIKNQFREKINSFNVKMNNSVILSDDDSCDLVTKSIDERTSSNSSSVFTTLEKFVDRIDTTEKKLLDEKFSKALYASAMPFSMVTNPFWTDFF